MSDPIPPDPRAEPDGGAGASYEGELAPGATLWAFTLSHPLLAQEALLAAMRLQARRHLELDDAAIVHKAAGGRVRIVQTKDVSTGQGALSGSWWGLLAGLFIPGGPLLGAALGAAVGGIFAKMRDIGINDDQMKQMAEQLDEGESALFLLVMGCHQARAMHEVGRFEARLLFTTADDDLADQVRERLAVDPWGL
jgi:uncharacterized membrane protein